MKKPKKTGTKASGRTRGPRRIEYIPAVLRQIAGVEELTTVAQAERLIWYATLSPEARLPFIRLGSSVRKTGHQFVNSATYAADIDGELRVIRRQGDPRRVHLWMHCSLRPWNLARLQQRMVKSCAEVAP